MLLDGSRRLLALGSNPPSDVSLAELSPDGHWLAYVSDESGRAEVYVASYPALSTRLQISNDGGDLPRWRRDGRELFYASQNKMMSAELVVAGDHPATNHVVTLFTSEFQNRAFDVTSDGQRFLVTASETRPGATVPVTVIVNWAGRTTGR